jgi:hypothetical protein
MDPQVGHGGASCWKWENCWSMRSVFSRVVRRVAVDALLRPVLSDVLT